MNQNKTKKLHRERHLTSKNVEIEDEQKTRNELHPKNVGIKQWLEVISDEEGLKTTKKEWKRDLLGCQHHMLTEMVYRKNPNEHTFPENDNNVPSITPESKKAMSSVKEVYDSLYFKGNNQHIYYDNFSKDNEDEIVKIQLTIPKKKFSILNKTKKKNKNGVLNEFNLCEKHATTRRPKETFKNMNNPLSEEEDSAERGSEGRKIVFNSDRKANTSGISEPNNSQDRELIKRKVNEEWYKERLKKYEKKEFNWKRSVEECVHCGESLMKQGEEGKGKITKKKPIPREDKEKFIEGCYGITPGHVLKQNQNKWNSVVRQIKSTPAWIHVNSQLQEMLTDQEPLDTEEINELNREWDEREIPDKCWKARATRK